MAPNVNQHSIGSPHNNGTYYVRRNVDTQPECHAIKVPELESKLHSSIIGFSQCLVVIIITSRVPVEGKSSVCLSCMKYGIGV